MVGKRGMCEYVGLTLLAGQDGLENTDYAENYVELDNQSSGFRQNLCDFRLGGNFPKTDDAGGVRK